MISTALLTAAGTALLPNLASFVQNRPISPFAGQGIATSGPPPSPGSAPTPGPVPQPVPINGPAGSVTTGAPGLVAPSLGNSSKIVAPDGDGGFVLRRYGGTNYSGHVLLRNAGGLDQSAQLVRVILRDRSGIPVKGDVSNARLVRINGDNVDISVMPNKRPFTLKPYSVAELEITVASPDNDSAESPPTAVSGWLLIEATEQKDPKCTPDVPNGTCPATYNSNTFLSLSLEDAPERRNFWASLAFLGSLGLALAILLVTIGILGAKIRGRMGSPTWSFQQSWGSNVTIGAAFVGVVGTLLAFPQRPYFMLQKDYNMLQALFAGIVALAPLVYGLASQNVRVDGGNVTESQGPIGIFLVAGGLILWGALGQIVVTAALAGEYIYARVLAAPIGFALLVVMLLLIVLLSVYGVSSLKRTVELLSVPNVQAGAEASQPPRQSNQAIGEWPLL
jgi:hypothetical protein